MRRGEGNERKKGKTKERERERERRGKKEASEVREREREGNKCPPRSVHVAMRYSTNDVALKTSSLHFAFSSSTHAAYRVFFSHSLID
jgi:hypothetical protein